MPGNYVQYAIRWVPHHATELAAFGRGWTGWCAETGGHAEPGEIRRLGRKTRRAPMSLARAGFGAVIRSPFRLAEGRSQWRLEEIMMNLSQAAPALQLPAFVLEADSGRVMLRPRHTGKAIRDLLSHVATGVRLVQAVPAPAVPGTADPGAASDPAEVFRIPLAMGLTVGASKALAADLERRLAPAFAENHVLSDLALMGDPGGGRPWRVVDRYALCRDAARHVPGFDCPCQPMPPLNSVTGSDWDTVIA